VQIVAKEGLMRTRRNAEHIRHLLQQAKADQAQGLTVADIARKLGISAMTLFRWRAKYESPPCEEVGRIRELELEVERLKRLVAEVLLDKQMLQDIAKKKW
jgi:putative transposase